MKPLLVKRLLTAATVIVALFTFDLVAKASSSFFWTNTAAGPNAWNQPANWSPNGVATIADTNIFGTNGAVANATTVNNEVTASTSVSTLLYTNVNNGQWDVTQIPGGVTLTVTTNLTVGFQPAAVNTFTTLVAMVDAGTLQVTGNTLTIGNNGSSSADQSTILDLSGLANFVYNATGGTITMSTGNRSGANFKLANSSNFVTAATWNDNTASSSSSASGNLTLGAGTNIINVGTFNISAQRGSSTVSFPAGSTGGLRLRGVGGTDTDRATVTLGNRTAGATSGGTSTGTLSLNGHAVDMKISTLTLGQSAAAGAAANNVGTGNLQFDTGTIDATTVSMAIAGTLVTNTANGTITVGANGTLTVGAGGISLVNESLVGQTASVGNLNISGTVNCLGNIIKTTVNGTGNITITSGTLKVTGNIGTPASPVDLFNLNNASLHLNANGAIVSTNIVATTVATAGTTTITIDAIGGVTSPITIPLISYTGADPFAALTLAPLPTGYTGNLVDNAGASRVDLTITPPPTLTWVGALFDATPDATWNTSDQNWLNGVSFSAYTDPDIVQFGDVASNTTVTVSGTLSPGNITVNNTLSNYVFTGSGTLSGATAIVKQGGGSLTLLESGGDNFSGGVVVSGGSILLDNANSAISGGASIAGSSSLQIGNNDANGTLTGNIADNGSLTFARTDNLTEGGVISGGGSVTKNGAGTLTLSGNNSFSSGLTINGGAVRASSVSSPGTTLVTVSGGAAFVAGAAHTNSFMLTNGIIGTSLSGGFTMSTNQQMVIGANSTNLIYAADPQSPTASLQFLVDGVLRGNGSPGGTIIAINGPTNAPDSGNGVRFRNTNAISDFNGTVVFTNNLKGELLLLTPPGASFSPLGTGKIVICAGAYFGTNGLLAPLSGGYTELNLRNSGAGSVTVGNDVLVSGTGAAVINALAGSGGVTMGNLTIGAGQELIGYKASGTPATTNVAIFPTVTLTGGNATFSPHSSAFGAAGQFGTDLALGAISEQTPGSGITMGGRGNLTLFGANTYSGDTLITNGVLYLTNAATIASPHIVVGSGARFDVSQLASAFALGASQTLSNSGSTAVLSGNAGTGSGTLALTYASGTPSFTVTNGTLTLSATTVINVKNTGAALVGGSYNIISAAASGNVGAVSGTAPSSVTVSGNGIATAVTPSLQIIGGQLFLVVPDTAPVVAHIVTNSVPSGQPFSTTITSLAAAAGWSDADGDTITLSSVGPTSNLGNSVTTDGTSVFYNAPVTAEDFFTYTISDGTLTANGTVYLEVSAPPAPANGKVGVTNGVPTITFTGNPNSTNVVQSTTNLLSSWTSISTNVADGSGLWQITDSSATNAVKFYRSFQPVP